MPNFRMTFAWFPSKRPAFLTAILLVLAVGLHAQADMQALGKEGQEAFEAGDYQKAAEIFQRFIKEFPDEEMTDVARYFTGLSLFALQKYDEAILQLQKASETKVERLNSGDENIVPDSLFYLGKALQAKAAAQPIPAERDNTLKQSVEAFNRLLDKFPDSPLKSETLLARAVSFVQLRDFSRAQADLEALRAADPNNPLNADIDYMLGFVFAEQAQALVNEFKQEEANAFIQKAREIYAKLADGNNLVIANEARFQLANLLFNEQRFEEAREMFRRIRSREALTQSQERIIEGLRNRLRGVTDRGEQNRLARAIQREQDKLNNAKNNPELAVAALIRVGDTFMAERRFDEARLIYRYARDMAEDEAKKNLDIQIITSLALQGRANEAKAAFEKFKADYKDDPLAETVEFSIGVALFQQERFEEALKSFEESLRNFPRSRVAGQIPSWQARVYQAMGKMEEALKSYETFLQTAQSGQLRLPPEAIERARRDYAFALSQANRMDQAIEEMRNLAQTATTPDVKEDATYQTAAFMFRANKLQEAADGFAAFARAYPNNGLAPTALFTRVTIFERLKKPDEAIAAARDLINQYPQNPLAPRALERIWKIKLAAKDYEGMLEVHRELLEKYPTSEFTIFALWDQAKVLDDQRKTAEALQAYQRVFTYFEELRAKNAAAAENSSVRSFAGFALNRIAAIRQRSARDMGNPALLQGEQLEAWKQLMEGSLGDLEKVVTQVAEPRAAQGALRLMVENLVAQVSSGMKDRAEAINLISRLAGGARTPELSLQIQIARANLAFDLGLRQQAIEFYSQAIEDPNVRPTWQDLERYGEVLLDNREYEKALRIFTRIQQEFESEKASHPVAIYGLAAANLGLGKTAEAQALFSRLKAEFPNSPKILDAAYGEGLGLVAAGKFEEAFVIWRDVLRSPRASNEIKARTLIAYGQALEQMADKNLSPQEAKREDGKPPANPRELAITYYTRVDLLFEAQADQAAEGLYLAVQAARRLNQSDQASQFLQTLQTKYPTSQWAARARQGT